MTISIIIPAYQCEATLRATVEHVLQADIPLAEILLIDDGSTDGTASLCDRLAEENALIRCRHKPNGGVSSARNLGIEAAAGDYIWFVDADDAVQPISSQVINEMRTESPDMVLFGMEFQYYRGKQLIKRESYRADSRMEIREEQLGAVFPKLFWKNYLSPVWNKFFKRSVLIDANVRFDRALTNYEDLVFTLQALCASRSILVLPEVFYHYKADYDHDRTVDRIARIDGLAQNTDRIADAFYAVAEHYGFDDSAIAQTKVIVLQIYLDLFRVKMLTTPMRKIRRQCRDFSEDRYFRQCEDVLPRVSANSNEWYRLIIEAERFSIWRKTQRRKLRSTAARIIKPLLKRT